MNVLKRFWLTVLVLAVGLLIVCVRWVCQLGESMLAKLHPRMGKLICDYEMSYGLKQETGFKGVMYEYQRDVRNSWLN